MRNNKGITMISLVITIIALLILTSITIYNGTNQLGIKRVNNLYADIESISTKVSEYYLKNGTLPIYNDKYVENKNELKSIFSANGAITDITNVNDGEDYYVLDLSKLDNLTLNYGDDYKGWSPSSTSQNIYIINSVTHQIYFPHGIRFNDEYFFTRNPDENIISPILLNESIEEFDSIIINASSNFLDDDKISIECDLIITGIFYTYDLNTFEYAWSEIDMDVDDSDLSYTKFNINGIIEYSYPRKAKASFLSKSLIGTSDYYYLYLRVMDINGKYNYKKIKKPYSFLTGRIPPEYQQVEYIQSSGTQWIDTEYVVSGEQCTIYADFTMTDFVENIWTSLSGTQKGVSTKCRFGGIQFYGNTMYCTAGDKPADSGIRVGDTNQNQRYQISCKYDLSYKNLEVTRSDNIKKSLFIGNDPINTDLNLYIFAKNTNSEVSEHCFAKLYNYKIVQDDMRVRDLVPCYRKLDNVKGLYDLVNGVFYSNKATTGNDFTAGDDIVY